MANPYYNVSGTPTQNSLGTSAAIRAEFTAIQSGFALLPTLSGNANLPIFVNSGASAMEAVSASTAKTRLGIDTIVADQTHAATSKATPVDADEIPLADSAATYIIKKLTWANLKATAYAAVGGLVAAGTGKTTPIDADSLLISDSAASNATKTLTWANLKATLNSVYGSLSADNLFTGANTFRNAAGIRSEQAATQDAIALIGRAGGTSSYEVTITPTTLTADRTVTAQDKTGTMALLEGTTTNDSASAGQVGEYVESVVGSVNAPTSGQYGDLTSISLTAGDWDVCALAVCGLNGATMTATDGPRLGISTTSGNSSTGLVWGDTLHQSLNPTTGVSTGLTIAPKRVSLSATTTYYLKMLAAYSAGTPVFSGRISARRVR